ncbi:DUF3592 domain-containing protein [Chloroflexus sp.]|uniref:DUF3592 domain-containing protein n=1 Tax=Chloroflexus sp. TaxID=1904827 RepID=UPI002ADDF906|nr:DUF3592 domain-containing protein [Chloroflexus sp.]
MEPKPLSRKGTLIIGLFFAIIGAVVIFAGWLWQHSTRERLNTMISDTGTVVDLLKVQRPGETASFYPIVEFRTQAGEVVRFEGSTGVSENTYRIGQQVDILYDPRSPQDARIDSWFELWLPPLVVILLGGGALVAGLAGCGMAFFDTRNQTTSHPG